MPTLKEVAEGGTYVGVLGAMAWVANLLRRATNDTEARAERTVQTLETDIEELRAEHREVVAELKTELNELRDEVERCHQDRLKGAEERAALRVALITAGIEIPPGS